MDKEYYLKLRNKNLPEELKFILVLESPPVSGKYFYDETGKTSEPLFNELMKALRYKPINKKDGLEFFKNSGFFLVDVTYEPVNHMKGKERNQTILSDFNNLIDDLKNINPKVVADHLGRPSANMPKFPPCGRWPLNSTVRLIVFS